MQFHILGPLEVLHAGRPVPLGGTKQRATLGYLLLKANTTVANSQLLRALWGDCPPLTARKMLQNAVSGLRRALSDAQDDVTLETRMPGYALSAAPERVDWLRFQELAEQGRTHLARGAREEGARTLRAALDLWRGPALSDLTEAGVDWPELVVVQSSRLDVLEDWVDAQLAGGRHLETISELAREAEAEPARERLCGQLMLALYRSGRQAAALAAYRRTRAVLVDQLGLDPGRTLRELERRILNHDPALAAPSRDVSVPAAPAGPVRIPAPRTPHRPVVPMAERKPVSVLLIRAQLSGPRPINDPEEVVEVTRHLTSLIRNEAKQLGGTLHSAVASVWVVLFGVPRTREGDAERAIRAALSIQDQIAALGPSRPRYGAIVVRCAVTSGEALVTYDRDDDDMAVTDVSGAVLDDCQGLLSAVAPGEVRICDNTRQLGGCEFDYSSPPDSVGWSVQPVPVVCSAHTSTPFIEREREMRFLRVLFDDVRRQHRPHLVTLLGEAGIGKSRLILELGRIVGSPAAPYRYLIGQVRPFRSHLPFEPLAPVVRACATDELLPASSGDTAAVARDLLADRLAGLSASAANPEDGNATDADTRRQALQACRRLLEEAADHQPLAVVLEDVHHGHDALLDFVEQLVGESRSVPLVVVVTARQELRRRRTSWGGGVSNSTTITLEPLSAAAASTLLTSLFDRHGLADRMIAERDLVPSVGRNPLFAQEYVRMLQGVSLRRELPRPPRVVGDDVDGRPVSLPQSVYTIIAARLDTLTRSEKAVLQDAAVLPGPVQPSTLAALSDRTVAEAQQCLEQLERHGFLRRIRREPESGEFIYCFHDALVRNVAYSQLPRAVRAHKQRRAESTLLSVSALEEAG